MKLLLLKKYNNYFNRKIKLLSTTAEYKSASAAFLVVDGINFNPNDGVTTTHVLGKGVATDPAINECDYLVCFESDGQAESISSRWFITEAVRTRGGQWELSLKRDSIADNFNSLLSCPAYIKKGFVEDSNKLILNNEGITVNQVKSDEIPLVDGSGCAWLVGYLAKNAPTTSITVQVPEESPDNFETIEDIAAEFHVDVADLAAALTDNKNNPSYFINDNIEVYATIDYPGLNNEDRRVGGGSQNFLSTFTYGSYARVSGNTANDVLRFQNWSGVEAQSNVRTALKNNWIGALSYYGASIKSQWKNNVGHPFFTKSLFNKLVKLQNNDTLILKQSKYYRVRLGDNGVKNTNYEVNKLGTIFADVVNKYKTDYNTWAANTHYDPSTYIIAYVKLEDQTAGKVRINYNELTANFYLEEVTDLSVVPGITATMSTTRNAMPEETFDMFAIPAINNTLIKNGANQYDAIGQYGKKIANAFAKELTSANVYDLQLLPYCPVPTILKNGMIDITGKTEHIDYDYIYQTGVTVRTSTDVSGEGEEYAPGQYEAEFFVSTGVATADFENYGFEVIENDTGYQIYPVKTTQTVDGKINIIVSCQINNFQDADHITIRIWYDHKSYDPIVKSIILYPTKNSFETTINQRLELKDSMKIDSQCDNYRLVSPNYQGSFDFNVAKNGGQVEGFIVNCTYKPYTPYIRVSPKFAWLYGTDYGDCRGLICGGDFSIGLIDDKWKEYQLQNKNYQNIFNREIQNMDVGQSIARENMVFKGVQSVAAQTIAGGVAGGNKGGASGAVLGALGGATLGAINLGHNINQQEKSLREQRDYAIDKFGLQLGNIQALPYTITKVSSFDINSKYWPFIEYYTCTQEEKEALRMKIQYEGMTLGVVGILGDYMLEGKYLQADLIRNDEIAEDSHVLEDIYNELTKGVYL